MKLPEIKKYFFVSVILAVLAAIMIILIQFISIDGTKAQKIFSYIIAATFWLSFCGSQIFFWKVNAKRKKLVGNDSFGTLCGLAAFFKNKESTIADVLMIASAITVLALLIFRVDSGFWVTVTVALLFLSFLMHCYLNGKNYRFIKELHNDFKE